MGAQTVRHMQTLTELSSLSITVLVDNATDMISPPCACCDPQAPEKDRMATYTSESQWLVSRVKGGAAAAMDFSSVCFAGHGLSLLLEAEANGRTHTLLYDAGPCGQLWTHNARSLDINPGSIDAVVLSHWHVDHSCGLPAALQAICSARSASSTSCPPLPVDTATAACSSPSAGADDEQRAPCIVDVHPSRPHCRGLQLGDGTIIPFNQDPTLQELQVAGAQLHLQDQPHLLLDDCFYVSGFIPRTTSYEQGNPGHATQMEEGGPWELDPVIADERFLMVNIQGRGPVVFSACSHAGIINVVKAATQAAGRPPCCIMGGLHLAPRDCIARIQPTVQDLVRLAPGACILPGHCTGWRAMHELMQVVGEGSCMPCSVGGRFRFSALSPAEQALPCEQARSRCSIS